MYLAQWTCILGRQNIAMDLLTRMKNDHGMVLRFIQCQSKRYTALRLFVIISVTMISITRMLLPYCTTFFWYHAFLRNLNRHESGDGPIPRINPDMKYLSPDILDSLHTSYKAPSFWMGTLPLAMATGLYHFPGSALRPWISTIKHYIGYRAYLLICMQVTSALLLAQAFFIHMCSYKISPLWNTACWFVISVSRIIMGAMHVIVLPVSLEVFAGMQQTCVQVSQGSNHSKNRSSNTSTNSQVEREEIVLGSDGSELVSTLQRLSIASSLMLLALISSAQDIAWYISPYHVSSTFLFASAHLVVALFCAFGGILGFVWSSNTRIMSEEDADFLTHVCDELQISQWQQQLESVKSSHYNTFEQGRSEIGIPADYGTGDASAEARATEPSRNLWSGSLVWNAVCCSVYVTSVCMTAFIFGVLFYGIWTWLPVMLWNVLNFETDFGLTTLWFVIYASLTFGLYLGMAWAINFFLASNLDLTKVALILGGILAGYIFLPWFSQGYTLYVLYLLIMLAVSWALYPVIWEAIHQLVSTSRLPQVCPSRLVASSLDVMIYIIFQFGAFMGCVVLGGVLDNKNSVTDMISSLRIGISLLIISGCITWLSNVIIKNSQGSAEEAHPLLDGGASEG